MLTGELWIDAKVRERATRCPGRGPRDRERSEVVDVIRRAMLEPHLPRNVEQDIQNRPLRGRKQDLFDPGLAFVSTAVAADELRASAANREVEDPRVRRVDQIQAHYLSHCRLSCELGLAVDQHDVPESAHGGVIRPRSMEGSDLPILNKEIVQGEGQLPVNRGPIRLVGRFDDDRSIETHLEAEVFADVRVVPVEAGVRELHLVGERPSDRDRCLGVVRHAVVPILQP
jgi:hypothetical protein